ncbi:endonuclease MutS2 [Atopobacter phocae]|uniref:endonuclease MutS2 n=1 Tax=Atopobacter phocae TaxID=136492 RepID=UPI000470CE9E|nr:endonuclease MutS2 [Atopobacter phocae]
MIEGKILDILEYKRVLKRIASETRTELGQTYVMNIRPSTQRHEIQNWLDETEEVMQLIQAQKTLPLSSLEQMDPALQRLKISADLNGQELASIKKSLQIIRELKQFVLKELELWSKLPLLKERIEALNDLPSIYRVLSQTISDQGEVFDTATSKLHGLRQGIRQSEQKSREVLNEYLTEKYAHYLSERLITIRNERYVIPVKAEFKGIFKGVVHDQSSTGQTLFIEPGRLVQEGNHLRELRMQEKQEVRRILWELSSELAPEVDILIENHRQIAYLDMIQARAKWAYTSNYNVPIINDHQEIRLIQAIHPLLDSKEAVPNTIALGTDYEAILITGPNTGGKTVLLKTLGLLQLMAQSGLYIPAESGSTVGIFNGVFADIGDEQSIEQSLSTFSAHMTNIIRILKQADDKSLILFDEIGSGTDPQEGAALAIAILDYIGQLGSLVVASTHYPELKIYGSDRLKTVNASMTFDSETLKPTYQLVMGVPGRSNALDISRRLGMPASIIESAQQGISTKSHALDRVIKELDEKRRHADNDSQQLRQQLKQSERLLNDLTIEYNRYQKERQRLLKEAEEEAQRLIDDKLKAAEAIMSDIREMQKEAKTSVVKEHELIDQKRQMESLRPELAGNRILKRAKRQRASEEVLKVGQEVHVLSFGQRGVLLEKTGKKEWAVQMGIIKMKLPEKDLEWIQPPKEQEKPKHTLKSAKSVHVSTTLDLRGKRFEDAQHELKLYLDQALLANYPFVTIIHGMGTGAIRDAVHQVLKAHSQVKRFKFGAPNEGGYGATIVYFKD